MSWRIQCRRVPHKSYGINKHKRRKEIDLYHPRIIMLLARVVAEANGAVNVAVMQLPW
jgi:hypothetical protein